MFQSLVDGLSSFIHSLYNLTGQIGFPSYGLAIIIFTILIKVILYPLTVKQMRSMKMTQMLQPKIKEVQEKYKNDPQKAQQKIMEIYKENGANPLSGCLPILLQMPIFIALFKALLNFNYPSPEAATFLWFHLSEKDTTYILPIFAGAATYVQQRLSSTNLEDQMQKTMLYVMPLMFIWFAATVPAGLALYWGMFSAVGAVQQYFINQKPVVLKEEVKENDKSKRKNR